MIHTCPDKKFSIKEIILMIIVFLIISQLMRHFLANHPDPNEDFANKKLITIFNIPVCYWNIIHIIVYFILCIMIDAGLCLDRHLFVFSIGMAWYIIVPMLTLSVEEFHKEKCNISYSNTKIPMLSDFIFNTIGQILYVIFYVIFNRKY